MKIAAKNKLITKARYWNYGANIYTASFQQKAAFGSLVPTPFQNQSFVKHFHQLVEMIICKLNVAALFD